jgi:hypothetical protein
MVKFVNFASDSFVKKICVVYLLKDNDAFINATDRPKNKLPKVASSTLRGGSAEALWRKFGKSRRPIIRFFYA